MADTIAKATKKEFPDGIQGYGTDALRFTFCALAATGRDIRFNLNRLEGYRNFCNKLWNAARYVLMNTKDQDCGFNDGEITFSLADCWIQSKLQTTINKIHDAFAKYRFDRLANAIYEFTWNEFCDWYLELSKPTLIGAADAATKRGTRKTLITMLETLLRLIHPLMPFITEEIWHQVAPLTKQKSTSIMLQTYPQYTKAAVNHDAEQEIEWLKKVIVGVRTIRAEMNIAPSKKLPLLLNKGKPLDHQRVTNQQNALMTLAKLESITWLTEKTPPPAATALVDELELLIPMAGLIDKDAELARLEKEINKLQKELSRTENKLQNPNYLNKAPAQVVAKEKAKAQELQTVLNKLSEQIAKVASY